MTTETLGDAFPKEQQRVRELIVSYLSIGPNGRFGAILLEDLLLRADKAAMSGDVVAMMRVYQEMQAAK